MKKSRKQVWKCFLSASCAVCLAGTMPGPIMAEAEENGGADVNNGAVSYIDGSMTEFDKTVMMVDGSPFFFNGVQIRDDKIMERWQYTDDQMAEVYRMAAEDGFTIANSQITWMMTQPDQIMNPVKAGYVTGGVHSGNNYGNLAVTDGVETAVEDAANLVVHYDPQDESGNSVAYLQFSAQDIIGDKDGYDASKIRIYVSSLDGDAGQCGLHLYGILDQSWDPASMTWSEGTPVTINVDGTLSGTEGVDYVDIGSTDTGDIVCGPQYYDLDVTDFINEYCYNYNKGTGKSASFLLIADPIVEEGGSPTANGIRISVDNDNKSSLTAPHPPELFLSRAEVYNYDWVDKVIGWSEAAELKLEFLWFGTDNCKDVADHRVPYYVWRNYQTSVINGTDYNNYADKMEKPNTTGKYPYGCVYKKIMCKNDMALRKSEFIALKSLYDHIAVYNKAHGDKKTVVGCDISNEPGGTYRSTSNRCKCGNCQKIWTEGGYTSITPFEYDTYWGWAQNLGKAVKTSDYPVWTRINFHTGEFDFVYRNENAKAAGETTYVDFVGYDPYVGDTTESYQYGMGLVPDTAYDQYSYGTNLPMIMETSGKHSNSDYFDIATIAGGGVYNIYNFMANDGNDIYNNGQGNVPVPNNNNIAGITSTNKWLNTMWYDLATRKPDGADGTSLVFFNQFADSNADVTKYVRGMEVNYRTDNKGVGIAVERSADTFVLASKRGAVFTLKHLAEFLDTNGIRMSVGYFDERNQWVSGGNKEWMVENGSVVVNVNDYETILVETGEVIPDLTRTYSINEDFEEDVVSKEWKADVQKAALQVVGKPGILDKSLRINKTSASEDKTTISRSFDPVTGKVTAEARIYYNPKGGNSFVPYLYDSQGRLAAGILFDSDGYIKYVNGDGALEALQSYDARKWYLLTLVMDTEKGNCDIYIDDIKKADDALLAAGSSDISSIVFGEEGSSKVSMFVDAVKVYQETGCLYPITSLAFGQQEIYIPLNKTVSAVKPDIRPEYATQKNLAWESSDEKIMTVDQYGNITANKIGSAVLTASTTDGSGLSAQCGVNVLESIPVTGITLNQTECRMKLGDTVQLAAEVIPSYAENTAVTWQSSNPNIVSAEDGLLTAREYGTVDITATSADGQHSAVCKVMVGRLWDFSEWGMYTSNGTSLSNDYVVGTDYDYNHLKIVFSNGDDRINSGTYGIKFRYGHSSSRNSYASYTADAAGTLVVNGKYIEVRLDSVDGEKAASNPGGDYQDLSIDAETGKTYYIISTANNGRVCKVSFEYDELDDNQAPVWTDGKIEASDITSTSMKLNWNEAGDDTGVTAYRIYQDSVLLATVEGTGYEASGLTQGTSYEFRVEAGDLAGNWSSDGPDIKVQTLKSVTHEVVWDFSEWGEFTSAGFSLSDDYALGESYDYRALIICFQLKDDRINSGTYGIKFRQSGKSYASYTPEKDGILTLRAAKGIAVREGSTSGKTIASNSGYDAADITAQCKAGTAYYIVPVANNARVERVFFQYEEIVEDLTAPFWNNGTLDAADVTQNSMKLTWSPAEDDTQVSIYQVFVNDTLFLETTDISCMVTGLEPGIEYCFQVQAGDTVGNMSKDGPVLLQKTIGYPTLNKTKLEEAIERAALINSTLYTPESYAVLQQRVEEVRGYLENITVSGGDIITQDVIDQAGQQVLDAISALVTVQDILDKTQLLYLIAKAADYAEEDYTPDSYAAFTAALEHAQAIAQTDVSGGDVSGNDALTQEKIDAALNALKNAINDLVQKQKPPVMEENDKTKLEQEIKNCRNVDAAQYTEESYGTFMEVLLRAEVILKDDYADQKQVDKILAELNAARSGLIKKEDSPGNSGQEENSGDQTTPNDQYPGGSEEDGAGEELDQQSADEIKSPQTGEKFHIAPALLAMFFSLTGAAAGAVAYGLCRKDETEREKEQ